LCVKKFSLPLGSGRFNQDGKRRMGWFGAS
jgi:hypothetical protein